MNITTPADFGRALKQGAYAWPGGYPTFFITADNAALCPKCAKAEGKLITDSIRDNDNTSGWQVIGTDINWEDTELICAHGNERIESAYWEEN